MSKIIKENNKNTCRWEEDESEDSNEFGEAFERK